MSERKDLEKTDKYDLIEEIEKEEKKEKRMNVVLIVLATILFLMVGGLGWYIIANMPASNEQQPTSTVEETVDADISATEATEEALTTYQEGCAIQALEGAVDEVYGRGNYSKPKYSDYTITGTIEKGVTVSGYIVYEGNSQKVTADMTYDEAANDFVLKTASIGGKSVEMAKQALEEEKAKATPTPEATTETEKKNNTNNSTNKSNTTTYNADNSKSSVVASYEATVPSAVTATVYVGNNGIAKAYAVSANGTKKMICTQNGSGTTTSTISLASGEYTIELEVTSGTDYSWNYSVS